MYHFNLWHNFECIFNKLVLSYVSVWLSLFIILVLINLFSSCSHTTEGLITIVTRVVLFFSILAPFFSPLMLQNGLKKHVRNIARIKYGFAKLVVIIFTSNMLNSMVMFKFFRLDWKCPFWTNFIEKTKLLNQDERLCLDHSDILNLMVVFIFPAYLDLATQVLSKCCAQIQNCLFLLKLVT